MKNKKISRIALIKKIDYFFSRYIKYRDGFFCITCGRCFPGGGRKINAGHYVSRRIMILRWDEYNVNAQCAYCNNRLSGDIITYRENLLKKYGPEKVLEIEKMRHIKIKYQMNQLFDILEKYKRKCEEIKN